MRTRRKVSSVLIVAAALTGLTATTAFAAPALVPLHKWVVLPDGSYGYDTSQPVNYTATSSEPILLPSEYQTPDREFRSSWVPTVANLSISKPTSEADFQGQYTRILDRFEDDNLNSMIFQVRPAQDAWYPTDLNPWSQFMTGTQGTDPGYDPLAYMVAETHKRGMEYHAWFNPYRVTTTQITAAANLAALGLTADQAKALTPAEAVTAYAKAGLLAADNYAVQHPDQVLMFNGMMFLNPGEPAARGHVVDSILEVAERYDVDGLHLDDYFYPYRTTTYFGDAGEDRAAFERYGLTAGYADTKDGAAEWRRDNITTLVQELHDGLEAINAAKGSAIELGISPFGIWEHASVDERGSDTPSGSSSTYSNQVFADTRGWVKDELIDYIIPQLYWSFDQAAAPYGELARWWDETVEGTDVELYIGHANYKHQNNGPSDVSWLNPDEVANQLLFDQTLPNVSGEVFYGYNDIVPGSTTGLTGKQLDAMNAKNASIEKIFGTMLTEKVLPPADPSMANAGLHAPRQVKINPTGKLQWKDASAAHATRAFAVYQNDALLDVIYTSVQGGSANGGVYRAQLPAGTPAASVTVVALDAAMNASAAVAAQGR